jgi:hypothetical protein
MQMTKVKTTTTKKKVISNKTKTKMTTSSTPLPFPTNLPSTHINMTLMEKGYIEPKKVKIDLPFQRDEQPTRMKYLLDSFESLGMYDEAFPIVLDQNDRCPDGKHRTIMGVLKNLPLIPYIRYHFETDMDRIKYFHIAQRQPQGMTARDELYAYKLGQHAYAELLYSLCGQNATNLFSSCSDLKMNQNSKMSNSNIKVVHLCYMINYIVLGSKSSWARTFADTLYKKSLPHLNQKSYKINCQNMDDFLRFFLESTGWIIAKKDLRFKEHFILAFIELYTEHLVPDPKFKTKGEKKRIQNILKKYRIIPEVVTNHRFVIIQRLLKEINYRKSAEKCYI